MQYGPLDVALSDDTENFIKNFWKEAPEKDQSIILHSFTNSHYIENNIILSHVHYAAKYDCIAAVRYLLACNINNARTDINQTTNQLSPVHFALENNNLAILKMLVAYGAELNAWHCGTLKNLETPLIVATRGNKIEILQFLLESGAKISINYYNYSLLEDIGYDEGATPLTLAAHLGHFEAIKILLSYRHIIKNLDYALNHALEAAKDNQQTEIVKPLIYMGAKPHNSVALLKETPIAEAMVCAIREKMQMDMLYPAARVLALMEKSDPHDLYYSIAHTRLYMGIAFDCFKKQPGVDYQPKEKQPEPDFCDHIINKFSNFLI